MRYPADIEFGQDNLQPRKKIEDAVIDELREGALRRVMQATGHFVMMEKPEEFNRVLTSFLDRIKF